MTVFILDILFVASENRPDVFIMGDKGSTTELCPEPY